MSPSPLIKIMLFAAILLCQGVVFSHGEEPDELVKLGPSGLPLPRFVSLKSGTVNVRKGPDQNLYPVSWIYKKRGLPVEIFAESDNWRRIRDSHGNIGWVNQSLLSGKRTAPMQWSLV